MAKIHRRNQCIYANIKIYCYYFVGRSLTHLLVHAILSTKDRRPFLRSDDIRNEIYAYMAGTLKNLDCHPIKIGGVENHVHVFSSLSKNIAFSDLIGRLKGSSSKRLKEKRLSDFSWQNGYGAFSVSESKVESVTAYILNQAEHHKRFSYREEVREIMERHRMALDERYFWDLNTPAIGRPDIRATPWGTVPRAKAWL
jgi:putative transposase